MICFLFKKNEGKMNFLRLTDKLLSILFENNEIIAIDKPYGINSHTNDSKVGNIDFINEGLIEIFEKQLDTKLFIVHRLDQTTTGVIIFAKSQEAAKKYADYFFNRQVKKTYLFVTASQSQKNEFLRDDVIIHKAKELEAKTQFKLLKRAHDLELWEANPYTGRNHQIRIHASKGEISILGDDKYNGQPFPFLCLHNQSIQFPNGIIIKSTPPIYFERLELLINQVLAKALFETDRRKRLFNLTDNKGKFKNECFRLVHSKNETSDLSFTIDQFGTKLIVSWYKDNWTDFDAQTFSLYSECVEKPLYVRLMHNRGKDPLNKSQFVICPKGLAEDAVFDNEFSENTSLSSQWVAEENQIKFEMRADSGQSFGLFLDQRLQRNWVLENSDNKTVLNLFSYTCGFSLVAALGKAQDVISIDTSKAVLNWGKKNFQLNNLDTEKYKFLCRDSIDFLSQCYKKNKKYDLIICDPPSFSRGEKGVFKIQDSLESLLELCLGCLNDQGDLLFSTNFEGFYVDDIRKSILKVQKKLNIQKLEINKIQSALDFELIGKKTILKSFLIRKAIKNDSQMKISAKVDLLDLDEG